MIDSPTHPVGESFRRIAAVPSLRAAWRKVRANRGAAGVDAVSLVAFERDLDANLAELSRNLLARTYEPLPARGANLARPGGGRRELAIPCVRDRVAQRAVLDALEPLFEPGFLDCSFAFRPGRSVEMAVEKIVVARANGFAWTLESDVESFFASIDHRLLLAEVSRVVEDADVLRLIRLWLDAGAMLEPASGSWALGSRLHDALAGARLAIGEALDDVVDGVVDERLGGVAPGLDGDFDDEASAAPTASRRKAVVRRAVESGLLMILTERARLLSLASPAALGVGGAALAAVALAPRVVRRLREAAARPAGAAQGSPISPLLSNVHLHPFDLEMSRRGFRLVRYCDDFVVLCRTEAEARSALAAAQGTLATRRLRLNAAKTAVVAPGGEFSFLGYGFGPGNRVTAPPTLPETTRRALARALSRVAARLDG